MGVLHALAEEADTSDLPAFVEEGRRMLERLHADGALLGTALRDA